MGVYLRDIPLDEAKQRFEAALAEARLNGVLGVEHIPLDEHALGRVLAEPIWARISSPHYHASAMDGFAVRAADTEGASPTAPRTLLLGDHVAWVDTGDPLPDWADAVIAIENTEPLDAQGNPAPDPRRPHAIRIRAAARPWQAVRPMGEDIVATELVLPAGHTLRPADLGAIAACGHSTVPVARKPRVAILPTGSELVPIGHAPKRGDIIEFNSVVLAAQVKQWGGEPTRFPITPDDLEQITARVREAARDHDLVLLNAGSSAGSEDYSARVVQQLGDLLVHGIAVRPGHPVILGMLHVHGRHVPIIGVPGYPVSAALTGEIFVQPLLARWLGTSAPEPPTLKAHLTRKLASPAGDDDYVRVTLGKVGERWVAAPLSRGAGVITSLVRADGILIVPRGLQGYEADAEVNVQLYTPLAALERTIVAIGSHDVLLDLLAQHLARRNRRLSSANVGSIGGLVALKQRHAHLAGCHLLDPESGEYNVAYVRRYLPDTEVALVTLAHREQGLIVARGNPKGIHGLTDLLRSGVRFVNRQRGSGTRILLDYALQQHNLDSAQIAGYDREEYTHLAVAAAVASGRADCGLGIPAAAQALGLDFVPLFQERYDLVIPRAFAESALLAPLFDVLHDAAFRAQAAALPGYDVRAMGTVQLLHP
ncbi:MAG: molybdopterin biosynthesis protein [Thermoflexales bacterium]|nr:molybdopterin biosynthesis protein [Thermoflexales bacterium]MDW8292624.1 molybdopterin biosynthesis protein [Anaerolineae bacterium]